MATKIIEPPKAYYPWDAELDKNSESVYKVSDTDAYIRQLKRALWLARAARACTESAWWDGEASDAYDVGNVNKMERCDKKHELWHNVYLKCRAMAAKLKENK